jgi:hypothetical protein
MIAWWVLPSLLTAISVLWAWQTARSRADFADLMAFSLVVILALPNAVVWLVAFLIMLVMR